MIVVHSIPDGSSASEIEGDAARVDAAHAVRIWRDSAILFMPA